MQKTQMTELLDGLLAGVQSVADFIAAERAAFDNASIEYKGYNNLVSYVDREAELRLRSITQQLLPGSGFIGEEGQDVDADAEYRWIVDPLDGTTNFIHDVPAYAISVALQWHGQTILGVVQDVPRQETFYAVRGGGAFRNGKAIRVSGAPRLERALLATGFPYANTGVLNDYLAVMKNFLERCHGMRRFGAAALDLAWVACGRLEGYYELGLQPWDVAAGALLVEEAGGRVTDFGGTANYVFGRQVVASNGSIHDEMLGVIGNRY